MGSNAVSKSDNNREEGEVGGAGEVGVTHGRAEGGAHGEAAVEAAPEAATEALPKRSSTN